MMDLQLEYLLHKVVPSQFHHLIGNIYDTSKDLLAERFTQSAENPRKFSRYGTKFRKDNTTTSRNKEIDLKAEYLTIARVIMELWSTKMFRYAEDAILAKAIEENYIKEKHLKFIMVFEEELQESDLREWVIQNENEALIDLLWNKLNLKAHFDEVHSHRTHIQKSYNRLKAFLPELHPEIVERHDLSKYAFSQALGYTLKFQHNIWHPIWKSACELHINNEPHHPQMWSKNLIPEKKLLRLKKWMQVSSCLGDCPYGIDLSTTDAETTALPLPFLLESYIDMVAIEWERKKGKGADITNSELIYMEEKYLMRYTNEQRKQISDLVNLVISVDEPFKSPHVSGREIDLLKTIPENERGHVLFRMEKHRKQELQRQRKKLLGTDSLDEVITSEEIDKKANDYSFYYNIAFVIMNVWDHKYRNIIENHTLRKAIKEGFIKESHLNWIFFAGAEKRLENPVQHLCSSEDYEDVVKLVWEEFKMREHFSQVKDHRYWLKRSYQRLSRFVPELPKEVIERHDLSKLAFSQAVGYTLKWVHGINSLEWRKACDLHLHNEPHHPQMWQARHDQTHKQKCLDSYLCLQVEGEKRYGGEKSQLDLSSENMERIFLLESFIDMVAVEWERRKNKREDLSDTDLIHMEERFLDRYSLTDKQVILNLMNAIREANKLQP